MKTGAEDKKKLIAAAVLGFLAIFAVGYQLVPYLFGSSTPPPPPVAPVVVTKPAAGASTVARTVAGKATKVASVNTQLDPTLHMEAMEATEALEYSGTGRNIFEAGPSPAEIAQLDKAKFDARPKPTPVPLPPMPSGPPPKPPINLKFFGIVTQDGKKRALLLAGDDVFLASAGDVVDRRYKVVSISANSITVEDVPNSNRQNLPLLAN